MAQNQKLKKSNMPGYHIDAPKSVRKSLAKIPLPWSFRIKQAIDRLEYEPYLGDKMQGKYSDRRKIRVWPYRIVYMLKAEVKIIRIMEVKHRGNASYE